jgi:predicted Rossmann fold nucleotide-binding protein DprA/Smf involved in DNA uptake
VSDESLAALLLTNRVAKVDAKPFSASEFWRLVHDVGPLDALLGESVDSLTADRLLNPGLAERVSTLLDAASAFASVREQFESSGIEFISAFDDRYPSRLSAQLDRSAPPMLYVSGPTSWLDDGGVAVVGSRDVSEAGAEVARAVATAASDAGLPVISGAAKGVDQLAMGAALEQEGPVVGITTEGLRRVSRSRDVRASVSDGRLCVATPYAPDAGFSPGNAMGRNKIIYALADVSVVVASATESGGTWAGATEALRGRFGRVAVWRGAGEGPGNAALEAKGATPIRDVLDALALTTGTPHEPRAEQLALGLNGQRVEISSEPTTAEPVAASQSNGSIEDDETAARAVRWSKDDLYRERDRFVEERAEEGMSPATLTSYRRSIERFISFLQAGPCDAHVPPGDEQDPAPRNQAMR